VPAVNGLGAWRDLNVVPTLKAVLGWLRVGLSTGSCLVLQAKTQNSVGWSR